MSEILRSRCKCAEVPTTHWNHVPVTEIIWECSGRPLGCGRKVELVALIVADWLKGASNFAASILGGFACAGSTVLKASFLHTPRLLKLDLSWQ